MRDRVKLGVAWRSPADSSGIVLPPCDCAGFFGLIFVGVGAWPDIDLASTQMRRPTMRAIYNLLVQNITQGFNQGRIGSGLNVHSS
jgi:hypothetical protein